MVYSASLLLGLLASSVLPQAGQAAGLDTGAKAKGLKYFGSATDNPELSDTAYVAQLSNTDDFGQITPGNSQKWDTIEPSQGTFSYTKGDVVAALAKKNGQLLRCHTLLWHNQLPSWLTGGTWTNATLTAVLKNHITNVVTHYKGQCYAWDVVNEGLNDDGTYRTSLWYNTIGPAYFPIAFAAAAAADPSAKLYYNDYNIEYAGAKATAAQNIVKLIKSYGVKIDGVGSQHHLIVGNVGSAATQKAVLAGYTALGVEVALTELDIRMPTPATAAKLAQQSTDYYNSVSACVQTTGCVGVTIWDYTDKYSWIPSVFSGQGAALPWDENLVKKPAYNGIISAVGGTPSSIPTPSAVSSAATPTGTGVAQKYGQCGGLTWNGPTECVAGTTCQKSNDYYSQCL